MRAFDRPGSSLHGPGVRSPRRSLATIVFLLTASLLFSTSGALAVPSESKLEQAREQARQIQRRADAAEDELASIERELDALQDDLAIKQEQLDAALEIHAEAEAQAAEASAQARRSERALTEAVNDLEDNHGLLGGMARDAYKFGAPSASPAMSAIEMMGEDAEALAERLHYLTRGMDARSDALERATALRTRVEVLTERAQIEEAEARDREAEAQEKRDEAARLHAEVQNLVAEQSAKVDRTTQLIAELEASYSQAQARISELEDQVEREREEARQRRERERRERQRRERARQQAPSGGGSASGSVSSQAGPSSGLRTVGGITVAASIAPQVQRLLNDARADGIVLGGHGYRSPQVTARLRITNGCPDVYNSPASSCRVPTARPGSSMHEKGLAIDFTYQGQTICYPRSASRCSGNAGFNWLRQNAHRYGLRNLPSEAWHWSTNGR